MKHIEILTKNNCPNCEKLKMFLIYGLGNKYETQTAFIHKEDNPERYDELVTQHNITSAPAIICEDEVSIGFSPSTIQEFLEQHTEQK